MKRFLLSALVIVSLGASLAWGQQAVFVPATMASTPVGGGTTAAAKIISGIVGKQIYVTGIALIPAATSVVTFTSGTGTNCATGTSTPMGAMIFGAGQTLHYGAGNGTILVIPSGNDFCITIGVAAAPGSISFSQF